MNKLKYIIFISCLLFEGLHAQVKYGDDGNIEETEIIIEKNKKVTFPEIKRTFDKTNIQRKGLASPEPQKYDFKDLPPVIPGIETKIKIATIKNDQTTDAIHPNYIRAGFGNYATTYLEGELFTKNKGSKFQGGLHAKHLASAHGPGKFKENSGNSLNFIGATGKYFFNKALLSGTADYTRTGVSFYGYGTNFPKESNDISQTFNQVSAKLQLSKVDTNKTTDYNLKAQYYFFNDGFKAIENEGAFEANVKRDVNEQGKILIQSALSISHRDDQTGGISRNLFNLRPEYRYQVNEKFFIRAGFNLAFDNDTVKNQRNIHFYPVAYGEYQLLDRVSLFAGLDGAMEKNLLRTFVAQNPFLAPNIQLRHTNKKYEYYAGFKGNITNYLVFKTSPSFSGYQNLSFFINDASDSSKFNVIYSGNTSNIFKFSNELTFESSQKFNAGLRATYYSYSVGDNIGKAWHRPSFEMVMYGNYNLYNKLAFGLDIFYISGINAKNFTSNKEYKLADIVDLNLTVNYKATERFSAFVYFYNILSQNYMRYNYYQNKGLNVMAGVSYNF